MEAFVRSFCSSNNIHYFPAAQQFPKTVYISACVFSVICSTSSTLGNTMILLALRKCQSLHSPSKALLCSLARTDFFVGLIVLPLFTAYYLMIILEIPRYYCVIAITYGRTTSFFGGVSLKTITTIAIDRYLAFHLRLRYQEIVKLRRVVCILVIERKLAAIWSGTWFWNRQINLLSGVKGLFLCCLIIPLCYQSVCRGFRRHVAQIHQQASFGRSNDFNLVQYKKTVNNMLWIYGFFLVCYIPYLSSLFAILAKGLNNSTRFALNFSAIANYVNSCLNPILYCWKIKELEEIVTADLCTLFNIFSHPQ